MTRDPRGRKPQSRCQRGHPLRGTGARVRVVSIMKNGRSYPQTICLACRAEWNRSDRAKRKAAE